MDLQETLNAIIDAAQIKGSDLPQFIDMDVYSLSKRQCGMLIRVIDEQAWRGSRAKEILTLRDHITTLMHGGKSNDGSSDNTERGNDA